MSAYLWDVADYGTEFTLGDFLGVRDLYLTLCPKMCAQGMARGGR